MQKLLRAYRADPTNKTAAKLIRYIDAHPMAECLLTVEDAAIVREIYRLNLKA